MGRVVALVVWFALLGCDDADRKKTVGEACTRSEQCATGLRCMTGACTEPDEADAG